LTRKVDWYAKLKQGGAGGNPVVAPTV
jgi:hypothetical protein